MDSGQMEAATAPHSRCFVVCGKYVETEDLSAAFAPFGLIQSIKIVRDRGVAYVQFAKASSAAAAIECLNGAILNDGRGPKLKVLMADVPAARGITGSRGLEQEDESSVDPDNTPPRSRLFMVVPKTADAKLIHEAMAQFPDLEYCKTDLIFTKGVVFIKFLKSSSALRVLETVAETGMFAGYKVKIMLAEPRVRRPRPDMGLLPQTMADARMYPGIAAAGGPLQFMPQAAAYAQAQFLPAAGVAPFSPAQYGGMDVAALASAGPGAAGLPGLAPAGYQHAPDGLLGAPIMPQPGMGGLPAAGSPLMAPASPGMAAAAAAAAGMPGSLNNQQRLFVVVSKLATDDALAKLFRRFPGMEYCDLKKDRMTGASKGYCYVNYSTPQAAALAIKNLNGMEFPLGSRQTMKVMLAEPMGAKSALGGALPNSARGSGNGAGPSHGVGPSSGPGGPGGFRRGRGDPDGGPRGGMGLGMGLHGGDAGGGMMPSGFGGPLMYGMHGGGGGGLGGASYALHGVGGGSAGGPLPGAPSGPLPLYGGGLAGDPGFYRQHGLGAAGGFGIGPGCGGGGGAAVLAAADVPHPFFGSGMLKGGLGGHCFDPCAAAPGDVGSGCFAYDFGELGEAFDDSPTASTFNLVQAGGLSAYPSTPTLSVASKRNTMHSDIDSLSDALVGGLTATRLHGASLCDSPVGELAAVAAAAAAAAGQQAATHRLARGSQHDSAGGGAGSGSGAASDAGGGGLRGVAFPARDAFPSGLGLFLDDDAGQRHRSFANLATGSGLASGGRSAGNLADAATGGGGWSAPAGGGPAASDASRLAASLHEALLGLGGGLSLSGSRLDGASRHGTASPGSDGSHVQSL